MNESLMGLEEHEGEYMMTEFFNFNRKPFNFFFT